MRARNNVNARRMLNHMGTYVVWACIFLSACDQKRPGTHTTDFTKADSLTETYLALQDTMLQVWNSMIYDDNRKIKAMRHLLQELRASNPDKDDELKALEERLDDLETMRYDQTTMSDPELVAEYDFASNSLISELISLAESQRGFGRNQDLQKLVDSISVADQRVVSYREEYDGIASRFNRFIDRNAEFLHQIDSEKLEKRPLFEMAAE